MPAGTECGCVRGGPVPIEPALLASEGMDAESEPASSERRAWMPAASVRRDGTGSHRACVGGEGVLGVVWVNGLRGPKAG